MTILRNRLFLATALGHMTVDTFNNAGPVLIAFLSVPMGLSNAQIGLAAGLYTAAGSVSQPLFGWIADRYGGRWLAGGAVLWLGGLMALATFVAPAGNFLWLVIPYALAGLGSGAFHPVGAANAAGTGAAARKAATATAFFFLFGQVGLAGGPVIAGFVLDVVGLRGLQLLALIVLPISVLLLTAPYPRKQRPSPGKQTGSAPKAQVAWGGIILLALLIATRSWAQLGTVTFLPKLFQQKGWEPTAYGAITGTMWFAAAIMGVLAGQAADRWGRRQVVFTALIGSVIPLYFLPVADGWPAFALALLAGGLTGAPHSIIVVISQSLLPGKKAMASGLTLGFMFGVGAIANLGIGRLADSWTLAGAMQLGAAFALVSGLMALVLPQTRAEVAGRSSTTG